MVAKVLELQQTYDTHAMAVEVAAKYTNWKTQRISKENEVKELRNFIFATDTTTTTNAGLPWKNSTTTPKLTQIRDNLHANYQAALFANPDWLRWEGSSFDDETVSKKEAIESYMKNKVNMSGFELTIGKLLYDYIDTGNVFGEVVFINEETKDTETGEVIKGYVGPKLIRNSLHDIVFNPAAASFADSPKITRYVKSIGELKEEMVSRPELKYNADILTLLEDYRGVMGEFKDSDLDKAEGYIADGFGSLREYYGSGYVEILELEGNIYDADSGEFYKNHLVTVLDRKWVVRNEPNPSWLGGDNRAHVAWRERPDNLYGMGPLDNLVGMQYRIDHLENLKADALDLTIHPPKLIKGDVDAFTWGPDAEIHIPDGDGAVELLAPNVAAFQVNNEIGYLMQLMEEMAGAPKQAMGIRTPGEKTAYEVQSLENASGRIFQDKIGKFEKEFLQPILNIFLEVARRNMNGSDLVRVMDDDLGVVDFLDITKEDITASGKLRPLGSSHFSARAQFIQNMTGVFNSPVGQMINPHVSTSKLAEAVNELFGWEKYGIIRKNVGVFEQAETQKLMNSAQESVDVDSITPTEPEEPSVPVE